MSAIRPLARLAAAGFVLTLCGPAHGQSYPTRTVRIVVPYPAGGGIDTMARILAQNLSDAFQRQVIVDNRAGAGTVIGTEIVAKAEADGYTLLLTNNALAANQTLYQKLPYDTVKDFAPIVLTGSTPNVVVVHPSLPVRKASELAPFVRQRSEQVSYASAGTGSASFLAMQLLAMQTRMKLVHIPYKGTVPAVIGVLTGEAQMMVSTFPAAIPYIQNGRLRALGLTSAKRSSAVPDVPTLAEAGIKGAEFETWYGLFSRTGVPPAVISGVNSTVSKILARPDVKTALTRLSIEPGGGSPDAFKTYFRTEIDKLARVIRASGARVE